MYSWVELYEESVDNYPWTAQTVWSSGLVLWVKNDTVVQAQVIAVGDYVLKASHLHTVTIFRGRVSAKGSTEKEVRDYYGRPAHETKERNGFTLDYRKRGLLFTFKTRDAAGDAVEDRPQLLGIGVYAPSNTCLPLSMNDCHEGEGAASRLRLNPSSTVNPSHA